MKELAILGGVLVALLIVVSSSGEPAPQVVASPSPVDRTAEVAAKDAAKDARIAELEESLRVAQAAIHAAPLVAMTPGGDQDIPDSRRETGEGDAYSKPSVISPSGVLPSPAAFVAVSPPVLRTCPGRLCYQPARLQPPLQYRQPVRLRRFPNAFWNR